MAIQHKDIVDPEQHEPKGISTAGADTVATAVDAALVWAKIDRANLDQADIRAFVEESIDSGDILIEGEFYLQAFIPDLATDGETYVVVPDDWTFVGAQAVVADAAADGGSAAAAEVDFFDAADVALGTTVSVPVTAVAGDMASFTATAPEAELNGPTYVRIEWTANDLDAANAVVPAYITLEFARPIPA